MTTLTCAVVQIEKLVVWWGYARMEATQDRLTVEVRFSPRSTRDKYNATLCRASPLEPSILEPQVPTAVPPQPCRSWNGDKK